jgi:D-3-phosphoglycerate dehydrogenase
VLKANRIAGAALDVFDREPTPQGQSALNPAEAVDRMGIAAVENILSIIDGKPIRDNVVNKEVLG